MSISRIILLLSVGLFLLVVFVPSFRHGLSRQIAGLTTSSETLTVATNRGNSLGDGTDSESQDLEIITLLGFDAIPAILDPNFVDAITADRDMKSNELVLASRLTAIRGRTRFRCSARTRSSTTSSEANPSR